MLKILQERLQHYMKCKLPDVQADLEKQKNQRSNCQHPLDHRKSKRIPEKTSISALLTTPKPLTVWITTNCGQFLNRWVYQTTLPAPWEICMQIMKQQLESDMEQWTGSKLGKALWQLETDDSKCGQGRGETGRLTHCWWECKLVQLCRKTAWRFLKRLNIELPCDPAILLLGRHPREMKTSPPENLYIKVHNSVIYNSQKEETTQIMNRKQNVLHPGNETPLGKNSRYWHLL